MLDLGLCETSPLANAEADVRVRQTTSELDALQCSSILDCDL